MYALHVVNIIIIITLMKLIFLTSRLHIMPVELASW